MNKKIIASATPFLIAAACLVMSGCGGKEPNAIFDGLYLEYSLGPKSSCRLSFRKLEGKLFLMKVEPEDCMVRPDGMKGGEMKVTASLKSEEGKHLNWGELTNIWLPPDKRVRGKHTIPGGYMDVTAVKKWNEWDAAIVHGKIGLLEGKWYYDVKTGFLVGYEKTFAGATSIVLQLAHTNAAQRPAD